MKEFEEMVLDEIIASEQPELIDRYYQIIEQLKNSKIAMEVIDSHEGQSISNIWYKVQEEEQKYTSSEFFPGDIVLMYPNIKEQRARNYITCDFSAGIIYPGSLYINYRPLIKNLTTGENYVLQRTIKVEQGYQYDLPTTITELESLALRLQIEEYQDSSGIEYSHLNQRLGGEIRLQKLKRRKIK